jgi:hypothetical protein
MSQETKPAKDQNRELILLAAIAAVGLAGVLALQFGRRNTISSAERSLVQAENKQQSNDAQTAAPVQRIPGELLRTSEYPEAGRPFKFFMVKHSQGPVYELDFGDGSPRKKFANGAVTHTFKKHGPCMVTLYARYEGQELRLDTLRKIVARVKEDSPVAPVIDY